MKHGVTKRWVWKAPGKVVPKWIEDRVKRQHPRVRFVWNPEMACFQLIERCLDGTWGHIRFMLDANHQTLPLNYQNTVVWLNHNDRAHCRARGEFERFMRELDQEPPDETSHQREMRMEGHDRLWHELSSRVQIPVNKGS